MQPTILNLPSPIGAASAVDCHFVVANHFAILERDGERIDAVEDDRGELAEKEGIDEEAHTRAPIR